MAVPFPTANGEVIQGKLVIIKRDGSSYLEIVDDQNRRVLSFRQEAGPAADPLETLTVGGDAVNGYVRVRNEECRDAICLDGETARVIAGCEFMNGEVIVRDARNNDKIVLDGHTGYVGIGGNLSDGMLSIFTAGGDLHVSPPSQAALHMDANTGELHLNGNGLDGGRIILRKQGQDTIVIDGDRGEIDFLNADFAEDFDMAPTLNVPAIEAGMVMVFDQNGDLKPCEKAYDGKVAGVVSGAGDYKPGIVMDKRNTGKVRKPIALVGKVFCRVDASENAIEVGDLLTTSATPGHAQKATDPLRTFGASIGKALKPLAKGEKGMIPIVVTLQ